MGKSTDKTNEKIKVYIYKVSDFHTMYFSIEDCIKKTNSKNSK